MQIKRRITLDKKLFRLNEDGVAEWIVAKNKSQALSFASNLWGIDCVLQYFQEYLDDCPEESYKEFIDYFVKEEEMDQNFVYMQDEQGKISTETKTVKEWLDTVEEVPSYFACQEY